jgi:hypothetical protein
MKRAVLALLTVLALAAGLVGGLFYTWGLDSAESYDSAPGALKLEEKFVYLALIGDLYVYEGDLAQARARLAELGFSPEGPVLLGLLERLLDSGVQPEQVRNLAHLAQDLGASGGVLQVFDPVATATPEASPTSPLQPGVSPTPWPTPTPAPTYRLVEQSQVCAAPDRPGRIILRVRDARGEELPGVQAVVSWPLGQDRFYTGLRPEQGAGYADFEMEPGAAYDVTLVDVQAEVASGLTSELAPGICPTGTQAVDWRLIFEETWAGDNP